MKQNDSSATQGADASCLTRPLSPSEIELLRKDLHEARQQLKGRFKHLRDGKADGM